MMHFPLWSAGLVSVRVLSFWCFSPGFSMTDLQKQGVRCILLTSGTLKPLQSFSSELKMSVRGLHYIVYHLRIVYPDGGFIL